MEVSVIHLDKGGERTHLEAETKVGYPRAAWNRLPKILRLPEGLLNNKLRSEANYNSNDLHDGRARAVAARCVRRTAVLAKVVRWHGWWVNMTCGLETVPNTTQH